MPRVVAAGNVWCCLIPYLYKLKTKLNDNYGVCGYYDMTAGFPNKTVIRYFIPIMLSFPCLQEPIRFSACDLSSTVVIVIGYYNSTALLFFFPEWNNCGACASLRVGFSLAHWWVK